MREKLGLTIFLATTAVVAAVVALARDSTWAVLAGTVVALLIAATLVVGAALASTADGDDRAAPGPHRLWRHRSARRRRPSTQQPMGCSR